MPNQGYQIYNPYWLIKPRDILPKIKQEGMFRVLANFKFQVTTRSVRSIAGDCDRVGCSRPCGHRQLGLDPSGDGKCGQHREEAEHHCPGGLPDKDRSGPAVMDLLSRRDR